VAWFALHWLGAQVVPMNPLCATSDLVHVAEITKAKAVLGLDLRIRAVLELTHRVPMPLLIVASLVSHLPMKLSLPYRVKNLLSGRIRGGARTEVHRFEVLYQRQCSPIPQPLLSDAQLPAVLQPTGGTTVFPRWPC